MILYLLFTLIALAILFLCINDGDFLCPEVIVVATFALCTFFHSYTLKFGNFPCMLTPFVLL